MTNRQELQLLKTAAYKQQDRRGAVRRRDAVSPLAEGRQRDAVARAGATRRTRVLSLRY